MTVAAHAKQKARQVTASFISTANYQVYSQMEKERPAVPAALTFHSRLIWGFCGCSNSASAASLNLVYYNVGRVAWSARAFEIIRQTYDHHLIRHHLFGETEIERGDIVERHQ